MRMKAGLSVGGLLLGVLLATSLTYWVISENSQPVTLNGSKVTSVVSRSSAPTQAPPSTAAAPTVLPATAQSSQASSSTAPPPSMAAPPEAPPATGQPSQALSPTASPSSTAAASAVPPATAPVPAEADMSEADRRQVQKALQRLNYYKGPIDGIFGPLSRTAIRRFQHNIGAEDTGYLSASEANRLINMH
jgi:Putative peptidoglycan binding domain